MICPECEGQKWIWVNHGSNGYQQDECPTCGGIGEVNSIYKQYHRKQIAELADWEPGFDMTGVSISDADIKNGSPKQGDKIARNPAGHNDKWLVAEGYFESNFEEVR